MYSDHSGDVRWLLLLLLKLFAESRDCADPLSPERERDDCERLQGDGLRNGRPSGRRRDGTGADPAAAPGLGEPTRTRAGR